MLRSDPSRSRAFRRLLGAALLIFVFFLPLHLHYEEAADPQPMANECACIHGTRLELAVGGCGWICAPTFGTVVLPVPSDGAPGDDWMIAENVRAPPVPPAS